MAERLVVIGGDAAGMSAASVARRQQRDLEIIALEKGDWTSYSACGIPYLIGGQVNDIDDLVARTPQEFRDRLIDIRMAHEAVGIDLERRVVEVRDRGHGRDLRIGFDQLMIGTGARPRRPHIDGIDCAMVMGVQTLAGAQELLTRIDQHRCRDVVVVGCGYIGLEMAEAFTNRDAHVTVVEASPEIMATLDPDMGALVRQALEKHRIEVRTDTRVVAFEPGVVHTDRGEMAADLVILGTGVTPNAELAADAGVGVGARGAISVNARQMTDVDGVWAAGDCAESFHLVSRTPVHVPLGTVANRQGRVAGINLGGGYATFPGVLGTAVTKLCGTEVARTGLTQVEIGAAKLDHLVTKIESTTRAGYYPGASAITVKFLTERVTGRLLGAQIVGEEGAAKRIDIAATAMMAGLSVHEMINLDLSYAPPFSPVWDPVAIAARQAAGAVDADR